jgi:hypothetical protein
MYKISLLLSAVIVPKSVPASFSGITLLNILCVEPLSVFVTAKDKSNGSASEPGEVSVKLISIEAPSPAPSTNLNSLPSTIVTSVPSPSSKTKDLIYLSSKSSVVTAVT